MYVVFINCFSSLDLLYFAKIAVGTKAGEIQLYDIASSTLIETIKAHEGALWSMHVRPDGKALVTGSADKDIKFWEIETKTSEQARISFALQEKWC
jgi:U3 small nucleolar RNA-associated protein 12